MKNYLWVIVGVLAAVVAILLVLYFRYGYMWFIEKK